VGVDQITDDSAVMALMNGDFCSFGGVSMVLALFFVAAALSVLRTAAFATWLAWLSLGWPLFRSSVLPVPSIMTRTAYPRCLAS
jgi:hypothetical protein